MAISEVCEVTPDEGGDGRDGEVSEFPNPLGPRRAFAPVERLIICWRFPGGPNGMNDVKSEGATFRDDCGTSKVGDK